MNQSISVYELVIEVTRRCNMSCLHCLRGEQENIDMNIKYVDELFSKIDRVSTLTLTGGEPSLVPDIIGQVLDSANRNNVEISCFYLVTNGKKITVEFMTVLLRMYMESYDDYGGQEMPLLQLSEDKYHDEIDRENRRLLKGLSFFSLRKDEMNDDSLINQGRAIDNYPCYKELKPDEFVLQYDDSEIFVEEGIIYLNCNGWLIRGCDWSYESQDDEEHECRICPVSEFNIEKLKTLEYAN